MQKGPALVGDLHILFEVRQSMYVCMNIGLLHPNIGPPGNYLQHLHRTKLRSTCLKKEKHKDEDMRIE